MQGTSSDLYVLADEMDSLGLDDWRDRLIECARAMRRMEQYCDERVTESLAMPPAAVIRRANGAPPILAVYEGRRSHAD
jgi:hypothetical protein